ncbi:MAG TPA: CrcB family protein [Planctomycetota bacterium]|nr:CrcB family protein [Planctomycetota bacterium]
MLRIMLIFLGGGVGSVLRYLMAGWVQGFVRDPAPAGAVDVTARATAVSPPVVVPFPAGTLAVNLTGCLLIGFLATLLSIPHLLREEYRFALVIGLLGGFTTFSSFAWEGLALSNDRQFFQAAAYIVLSVAVGLAAAWAGGRTATAIFGG